MSTLSARIDRTLLTLLRLYQQKKNGIAFRTVQTNDNRLWPIYHSRPEPASLNVGVPIVFFHGFGNDGTTWFSFFSLLGARRELVTPDLPGFGMHALDRRETPEPQWYCSVVAEFLRELTVRWGQPPIVVGKSMGGLIAGLVAGEVPNLVRALVLIAPAGIESPTVSPFWHAWSKGSNLLLPRNEQEWDSMLKLLYAGTTHVPGFARRETLRIIADRRDDLERIFSGLLSEGYNPLGDSLGRIACPVTVVWGDQDRVMDPSGVNIIRQSLPSARIHILEGCGHSPTRERPDDVGRILLDVISQWG